MTMEPKFRRSSPGRRRLRFSFQINDVKDPIGSRRTHCLAPVAARSGVSSRPRISCQSTVSNVFLAEAVQHKSQKPPWGREVLPSSVQLDSIGAGCVATNLAKIKAPRATHFVSSPPGRPAVRHRLPGEARLIWGGIWMRNPMGTHFLSQAAFSRPALARPSVGGQ